MIVWKKCSKELETGNGCVDDLVYQLIIELEAWIHDVQKPVDLTRDPLSAKILMGYQMLHLILTPSISSLDPLNLLSAQNLHRQLGCPCLQN